MLHLALHFIVPAAVVAVFFRNKWLMAYVVLVSTMIVDIDHLWADPIYDPGRCSVGFHFLHGLIPILGYVIMCFIPMLRLIGIGLVIHMLLDSIDCQMTNGVWFV